MKAERESRICCSVRREIERQRDNFTSIQINRHEGRKAGTQEEGRQADRQTSRQADRQAGRQAKYRQTDKCYERTKYIQ